MLFRSLYCVIEMSDIKGMLTSSVNQMVFLNLPIKQSI